jgi:hypothetical protein
LRQFQWQTIVATSKQREKSYTVEGNRRPVDLAAADAER